MTYIFFKINEYSYTVLVRMIFTFYVFVIYRNKNYVYIKFITVLPPLMLFWMVTARVGAVRPYSCTAVWVR